MAVVLLGLLGGIGTAHATYNPPITATGGNTPRAAADMFGDVITAGDIGMKCDGTTDDSGVLQTYITPFTSFTGPTIFIPAGTCLLKGIILPNGRVTIHCAGKYATTLKLPNSANTYMFTDISYTTNQTSANTPRTFQNCGFDGNVSHQSVVSPLIIYQSEMNFSYNRIFNVSDVGMLDTALGANGSTCVGAVGNPRIYLNAFNNIAGAALAFVDGGCISIADAIIQGNTFSANAASCDPGGLNYQIYVSRAAGFKIQNNSLFNSTGCGNIHAISLASTNISGNTFDSSLDTCNGATPLRDVYLDTGGPNAWGGLAATGNVYKTIASSLPGACTSWHEVEVASSGGGGTFSSSLLVGGSSFFSTNLAGTVSIAYTGTHVTDIPLIALGNAYMGNMLAPIDPNIRGDGPWTVAQNAAGIATPADTTEDTLATVSVPGLALGTNGCVNVTTVWSFTGSTNAKTMRVRIGGISGTAYLSNGTSTAANTSASFASNICNRGATNSQVGAASGGTTGFSNNAVTTSAVNTANAFTVVITGQKASAGELLQLERYTATLAPMN